MHVVLLRVHNKTSISVTKMGIALHTEAFKGTFSCSCKNEFEHVKTNFLYLK